MIELSVDEDHDGVRLDKFLRERLPTVPTSHLFKMIRTRKVRVNGARGYPDQPLATGDVLVIRGDPERLLAPPEPAGGAAGVRPGGAALVVLAEEDSWLAIDKPAGMAAHPGSGVPHGTVVDVIRAQLGPKAVRNGFQASPAHRLDRDTSGVLLVAKRRPAMVHFTDVFTRGAAKKRYLALVKGAMPRAKDVIDLPLAEKQQSADSKSRRGVNMQRAVTRYRVLGRGAETSLLECTIDTGRTHQIRRHLLAIGHPVAGDRRYGDFAFNRIFKAKTGLKRLFLHARSIRFPAPAGPTDPAGVPGSPPEGAPRFVFVEAPLPAELADVLRNEGLGEALTQECD